MGKGRAWLCVVLLVWGCNRGGEGPSTTLDGGDPGPNGGGEAGTPDATQPPSWDPSLPSPLAPRVDNTTCKLPAVTSFADYETFEPYPGLRFDRPLWVGTAPGEPDTLYVAEQDGTIWAFDDRSDVTNADREVFLQLEPSRAGNEEGLLGLAFHPDYADNGRFFVHYSVAGSARSECGSARCSLVTELARQRPRRADPASEKLLLAPLVQPASNHNGGALRFGPDGYLYIAFGDGGGANDRFNNGQNTNTWHGSILRVDVDRPAGDRAYGIPADNPLAQGGGLPEIYAYGLRNPWQMHFDFTTGALWVGDVGQDAREEIDRIDRPGLNLGWPIREGFREFRGGDTTGLTDPVYDYPRAADGDAPQGESVTGGLVYRGSELDELYGAYLFADFVNGGVWALREVDGGPPQVTRVGDAGNPAAFGTDAEGRVLIADLGGRLLSLRRTSEPAEPVPELLSATGCYSDTATHAVAPGVLPYDLNVPFWSDGAIKQRWIALPAGARGQYRAEGALALPLGTVLIKTFTLRLAGEPTPRRIETRMLVRQAQGYRGFVWRWREDQRDAELLDGPRTETFQTVDGPLTWSYPSRAQCDQCHTRAAGGTLGWRAAQLNRVLDYGGTPYNQLAAFAGAGYLDGVPGELGAAPRHPRLDDASAGDAARARAWLDANCAMCHLPDGPANASIDLRASVPFADTGLCDALPTQGDLGLSDARLLAPGDGARSVLLRRIERRGDGQMPPLASRLPDPEGVALVRGWIEGLARCP